MFWRRCGGWFRSLEDRRPASLWRARMTPWNLGRVALGRGFNRDGGRCAVIVTPRFGWTRGRGACGRAGPLPIGQMAATNRRVFTLFRDLFLIGFYRDFFARGWCFLGHGAFRASMEGAGYPAQR